MFYFLSKTLDVFLSPLTWALLGAVISLAARRRRALSIGSGLASIVILYAFAIEPVANALWSALEAGAQSTVRKDARYDVVVVLSGMVDDPSRELPSFNENVDRLIAAYDLLRDGRAGVALLSGGARSPEEPPEAPVLAARLEAWGIAKDRLIVEHESRNTHENAMFSARIIRERGWKKVLLVTSAFHMPRAIGCFRSEGVEADTLSVDHRSGRGQTSLLPRASALDTSTIALRELSGRVVYRARGYSR